MLNVKTKLPLQLCSSACSSAPFITFILQLFQEFELLSSAVQMNRSSACFVLQLSSEIEPTISVSSAICSRHRASHLLSRNRSLDKIIYCSRSVAEARVRWQGCIDCE